MYKFIIEQQSINHYQYVMYFLALGSPLPRWAAGLTRHLHPTYWLRKREGRRRRRADAAPRRWGQAGLIVGALPPNGRETQRLRCSSRWQGRARRSCASDRRPGSTWRGGAGRQQAHPFQTRHVSAEDWRPRARWPRDNPLESKTGFFIFDTKFFIFYKQIFVFGKI